MKITLKQLEVFIAIAKTNNMSQAADKLYISQSACSMALSALENQLGSPLFERFGKRLALNEYGRFLLPKAISIISQVQEIQDMMLEQNGESGAGHLLVGASLTIGNYLLPKIIGDFITLRSSAKISLQIANTEAIIQRLLEFDIDVGLVEGQCLHEGIEVFPWGHDKLVIVAAPQHPLVSRAQINRNDLLNSRWILREKGSGTRESFDTAMNQAIQPFLELGHHEAIKQAVQNGLGLGCLSQITVSKEVENGDLVILKTSFLKLARKFYLLLHKDKYKTKLLREFIKMTGHGHAAASTSGFHFG